MEIVFVAGVVILAIISAAIVIKAIIVAGNVVETAINDIGKEIK